MGRRHLQLVVGAASRTDTSVERLRHRAFEHDADSIPLASTHLNDGQRLGVLLQALGVLAHVGHAGLHLADGWRTARMAPDGRLLLDAPRPGRSPLLPQAQLLAMMRVLFGHEAVRGRGPARSALRRIAEGWQQMLTPIDLDRAVGAMLDRAPMLWGDAFAVARTALAAVHVQESGAELWLAGPGPARARLLGGCDDRSALEVLLASSHAAEVWAGVTAETDDPRPWFDAGRFRKAVEIWDRRTLKAAADLEVYAEALFALGRFERALEALRGLNRPRARLVRIKCRAELGDRGAAAKAAARLGRRELDGPTTIRLAEVAMRLATLAGRDDQRNEWSARALRAGKGTWRARARLVAAMAAYDSGDADGMEPFLELSPKDLARPDVARRWHHARALQAKLRGDGMRLVEETRKALAVDRRRLPRSTAGRLWTTMVVGYGLIDDLQGAEKAILHSLRLLGDCDGPIGANLAWYNLAEVRVRRGRFDGIEAIVSTVLRENRRAGNVRGQVHTQALLVRAALGRGRFSEALDYYQAACRGLAGHDVDLAPLHVLAARVYGQRGQPDDAARAIEQGLRAVGELAPEAQPALFAQAGMIEAAEQHARDSRCGALWRSVLARRHPTPEQWSTIDAFESYRQARLIYDIERVSPGIVPPERLDRAAEILREHGAGALADRLGDGCAIPWSVIDRLVVGVPIAPRRALEGALTTIGCDRTTVVWEGPGETRTLIDGANLETDREHAAVELPCAGGNLIAYGSRERRALTSVLGLFASIYDPDIEDAATDVAVADEQGLEIERVRALPAGAALGIVGHSQVLRDVLERVVRFADAQLPVLIFGESGTGKELTARLVHTSSRRANGPFLAVNCAALSESLILSDLFGHVRGAFTGADRDHRGVFEAARGGTVFLDEIGDLPPSAQGSLLRVLQEREIRRVGETHPRTVDVRIVAATHRDLPAMIEDGGFRRDLYFRLKAATVELPPLRSRGRDLERLATHFLAQITPHAPKQLTSPALRALSNHDWPGNIRELRNVLEVAATLATTRSIDLEHIDLPDHDARAGAESASASTGAIDYHGALDQRRRELVITALESTEGNQAEAARRLGISRQALSYLVRKLDLFEAL